jgi:hypothetical protein
MVALTVATSRRVGFALTNVGLDVLGSPEDGVFRDRVYQAIARDILIASQPT